MCRNNHNDKIASLLTNCQDAVPLFNSTSQYFAHLRDSIYVLITDLTSYKFKIYTDCYQ